MLALGAEDAALSTGARLGALRIVARDDRRGDAWAVAWLVLLGLALRGGSS